MTFPFLSVAEATRRLGKQLGRDVHRRELSDLLYAGGLGDDRVPLVAGRRLVPEELIPEIAARLQSRGGAVCSSRKPGP